MPTNFQLRLLVPLVAGLLSGCGKKGGDEALLFPDDAQYASRVGRPVAEAGFRGVDLSCQPIALEAYRGRVLLLDFWASWRPKCMEMFPAKLAAYKRFHHLGL
jgi:thiol-disulfide isomerase/thioredoxin